MEKISYWNEIHELRIQLKKVAIPYKKFFRSNEKNINNNIFTNEISEILF